MRRLRYVSSTTATTITNGSGDIATDSGAECRARTDKHGSRYAGYNAAAGDPADDRSDRAANASSSVGSV